MKTPIQLIGIAALASITIVSPAHATPAKSNNTLTYACSSENSSIKANYSYQGNEPIGVILSTHKATMYLNRNLDVTPNEVGYRFTNADGYEWTTDTFVKINASQAKGQMLMLGNAVVASSCANIK